MKIGEFARVCNVTKDTVRYYVNIGLLIPKMQGSQRDPGISLSETDVQYD